MTLLIFNKTYRILAYKIMLRLGLFRIKKLRDTMEPLKPTLRRSRLFVTLEEYIATAVFTILITLPFIAALLYLLIVGYFNIAFGIGIGLFLAIILFLYTAGVFLGFLLYPSYRLDNLREEIEEQIPYAAAHMATIAGTGVPLYQVFKIVGNFEEYGKLSEECKRISRNIDIFGYDTITAISEVAKDTPSPSFKDLLWGLVAVERTGGDKREYLFEKSSEFIEKHRNRYREYTDSLEVMAEVYTTLFVAGPVLLVIMLTVMGTMGGLPVELESIFILLIYILLPILSIGFMVLLEGAKPETME